MEINPSDFTRRITLTNYDYVQGDAGGTTPVSIENFTTWAKWEEKGGGMSANQAQMMADATVQTIMRYRPQVTTNWIITYEGQNYKINKIITDTAGYKRFMIIDCSVTIKQTLIL